MADIDRYYGHLISGYPAHDGSCISGHRYTALRADGMERKDEFSTLLDINI